MRCALYRRHHKNIFKTDHSSLNHPEIFHSAEMGRQSRNITENKPATRNTRSSALSSVTTRSTKAKPSTDESSAGTPPIAAHRPSGGRHLQPPVGNDAKLKHKVKRERGRV
jgi:hypothetical protein